MSNLYRGTLMALVATAGIAAFVVLFLFDPSVYGFYPRCPLFVLSGLQCAGCGTLRAAYSLLHGDLSAAIKFNPFLVLATPLIIVLLFKPKVARNRVLGWAVVVLVIVYSVVRNCV